MKKNITINLSGRLFQIDEDACDMLQHYIDSLRSHFGRQAAGDEIVNDIEERIAELFDEQMRKGSVAITIDHVKDIITRIGKPEQLAGDGGETKEEARWSSGGNAFDDLRADGRRAFDNLRASTAGKRLFRNPKDKLVFGVLSGVAAYTNTDVLFWRLGTVIFTFFYGIGFLIYIVMALIMTEARTPEQRLQMEGKEVNPQNLADVVAGEPQGEPVSSSGMREVLSLLLKIVIGFFVGIAAIVGFALAVAFFGVLMTVVFALVMPAKSAIALPFTLSGMGLTEVWAEHPAVLIVFALSLLATLFIPVYAIVHLILSLTKKVKPMSVQQRVVLVLLWLMALCCTIPSGGSVSILHDQYRRDRISQYNQMVDSIAAANEALAEQMDSVAVEIVAFSDTTSTEE